MCEYGVLGFAWLGARTGRRLFAVPTAGARRVRLLRVLCLEASLTDLLGQRDKVGDKVGKVFKTRLI